MLSWLYDCTVGSRPWHKSVANASANKPQSFEFVCFCTLSLEKVTVEPVYNSMRHEWSMATALTFWYKLSYTLTVPGLVAIVLRQTQCEPVFMICTNSLMAGVTNAPTIAGSRRPSTRGNFCFRKTCWQGNWIGWLFFLLSLNQSGKLAYSFFWLWGPVSSGDFFGFSMMFFFGWVTSMKIPFFWWHKGTGNFIYTRYV